MRFPQSIPPLVIALLLTACDSCGVTPRDESQDVVLAQTLAGRGQVRGWTPLDSAARGPVLLYVDRSRSMRGFLDPQYPTRVPTDYRSVIDAFDAGLAPQRVFGFGNRVQAAEKAGLGVLGNQGFYDDGNTEMEQVFDLIAADTAEASTHVIIGDGRRSSPDVANNQYVRLRALADRWTAGGGTFLVAASRAPFHPVKEDPSACGSEASEQAGKVCPLYAFAFAAPGQESRVASTLARAFEHLFVAPLPAVAGSAVALVKSGQGGPDVDRSWARAADGTPIVRVRSDSALNVPARVAVLLRDSTLPLGRAQLAALRGEGTEARIFVRPLADSSPGWRTSPPRGALVRTTADPFVFEFFSRGADNPAFLYRIELRPTGVPGWLQDFDAEAAGDPLRTFGLGRLFERFRITVPESGGSALTFYAAVN